MNINTLALISIDNKSSCVHIKFAPLCVFANAKRKRACACQEMFKISCRWCIYARRISKKASLYYSNAYVGARV